MRAPEINISQQIVDGIEYTHVTQPESETVRAAVILPFDTTLFRTNALPVEIPHLLEHVVFCGDSKTSADEYADTASRYGGYANAFTTLTNNGKLTFESTQPDINTEHIHMMFKAVFSPALRDSDIATQKIIVANELTRYLQDAQRQRYAHMSHELGLLYKTDEQGLQTLPAITRTQLAEFYNSLLSTQNVRVVLSGNPDIVDELTAETREIIGILPHGERTCIARQDFIPLPDYHADTADIQSGHTQYSYEAVVTGDTIAEGSILLRGILAEFAGSLLNDDPNGFHNLSRNRGLSYGVRAMLDFQKDKWKVSIGDSTKTTHVAAQIALMYECINRLTEFPVDKVNDFLRRSEGRSKLYPPTLISTAKGVESSVSSPYYELFTPGERKASLAAADPAYIVSCLGELANHFSDTTTYRRASFGDNPFA